jgi:glutathione synthase/RimK-type ligase-like ATP-grasp enzyme
MKSPLIGILRNENVSSAVKWEMACDKRKLTYKTIDLTKSDWFEQINSAQFDFFLLKPPGKLERYKTLYDERLYIISKVLGFKTFPSFEECYIYENKRLLSYFLRARNIPHPPTYVFYDPKEALDFVRTHPLPLVGKTSIGASGTGVVVLKDFRTAKNYIKQAFSKKGIKRRLGPNRVTGTPKKWIKKALNSPSYFVSRIKEYLEIYRDSQHDFIILQEYIPHDFEWRAVRIGDSYFAHKKIKYGEKASGTKGIDYLDPPRRLLDFVRDICESNSFTCMAVDLFEDSRGGYLVNELQTIFGHVQDYILAINGKPGRFVYQNGSWIFEAGDFNSNESYDLRLQTALEIFNVHE